MKKITTKKAILTLLLTVCAVSFSVSNANNLSMKTDTMQIDTTCFAWFSYESLGDGKIAFTDSSWINEQFGDTAISWHWTFGDGTESSLMNPIHIYGAGITNATVCYTVYTTKNNACSVCRDIQVRPDTIQSCTADFGYSHLLMDDSIKFHFYDLSSGSSPIAWRHWVFPDSSQYSDSSFVHAFDPNLSSANVCLTIGTATGCQASVCKNINLKSCIADFSYTSYQNGTVKFINQSQVVLSSATWHWYFGDGTYSNQLNPIHTYAPDITKANVCLTVMTPMDSCTICKIVYVKNISDSCRADFVYEKIINSPTYYFRDVSIPQNDIAWRQWEIDDSAIYADTAFMHTFSSALTQATVCLSIGTYSGCQSQICKTINLKDTVPNDYCKANFTYTVTEDSINSGPLSRYRVYFTDLSYSSGTIISWFWSFGDGTYSQERNPSHLYMPGPDTIYVSLIIQSNTGCMDTISRPVYIPGIPNLFSMSGIVQGKNELLPQGIIVLYKKADNGFFMLYDANIINNGIFSFIQLNQGKYILYAMPHMYLTEKYYPTYYVNKLHWANAYIIDLNSNIGGLTLKMVSTKIMEKGIGTISGTVVNNNKTSQLKSSRLKSVLSGVSTPVYLYTPSGEVLTMSLTDESNVFRFDELPYGTYVLKIESLNLPDYETTITLSPETPEVSDVIFNLENPVTIKDIHQGTKLTVRNVDDNTIALRASKGGEYNITLVSLSGKTIFSGKITLGVNSEKVLRVGSASKGIYILKLHSKTDTMITKFFK